jgi:hypothetical protein
MADPEDVAIQAALLQPNKGIRPGSRTLFYIYSLNKGIRINLRTLFYIDNLNAVRYRAIEMYIAIDTGSRLADEAHREGVGGCRYPDAEDSQ